VAAPPGPRDRLKAWLQLHAALSYLRGPYLGFLSAPSVLELVDHFQAATFLAGHAIQAEGLSADCVYLIREDEVVVEHAPDHPGTAVLGARDCFGARALLGEAIPPLAEARTDVECLALGRAAFDGFAADRGADLQTFQSEPPRGRPQARVAEEEATDCGLACLAMVARARPGRLARPGAAALRPGARQQPAGAATGGGGPRPAGAGRTAWRRWPCRRSPT
jgi:hypothetical protein